MAKKYFLIHGLGGRPDGGFRPWLKAELESRGHHVESLSMPEPDDPHPEAWLDRLREVVGTPDKDTVLVGHSLGGLLVLRYLELLPPGQKVGLAVCVAGVVEEVLKVPEGGESAAERWFGIVKDDGKVRVSAEKILAFFSDNDPFIPLETKEVMERRFGAQTFVEHDMGHYNGSMGVKEVPLILQEITK
jgi:predicted alpha/beta hydrolase family esterase